MEPIGVVYESSASSIIVKMDFEKFELNKVDLKIGKHLKISVGNHNYLIASIKNIKAVSDGESEKYLLTTEPVGTISDNSFIPGSSILPSPTENVYIADNDALKNIFLENEKYSFKLGRLVQDKSISLFLDGNNFFSKHIGIVGSTGSGKSCTVAKILQEVVGIKEKENKNKGYTQNSHIIIFDIHSEYKSAFTIEKDEKFSLNYLDVEKLKLPYWLMNCEELESLFIESNEANSHNQISQFRRAVILNKEMHNPELDKVTYDTPVYFNINEVYNYICNMNEEVINKVADEDQLPKIVEENKSTRFIKDKKEYF